MENINNRKLFYSLFSILVFAIMIAGLSYAFFIPKINDNETSSTIAGEAANLTLEFREGTETISGTDIIPGWHATKTFRVINNSSTNGEYTIYAFDIDNPFVDGGISVELTSTDGGANISKTSIPTDSVTKTLSSKITILPHTTHTYTVEVYYNNLSIDQSADKGKTFSFKVGITKEENQPKTLNNVLENEATSGSGLAQTYTGSHQDSFTKTGTKNIYYYYASNDTNANTILEKNNVIFAGHCWQMIRTTDTGGVKMIYNGEPDANGACGTDRGTHVGYNGSTSTSLSSNYWYGTSYTYDSATNTFSLAGTKKSAVWSDTTYSDLIGLYTCKSANENETCSTLYYIESYSNSSYAYVLQINSSSHYSQFGEVPFNSKFSSPSYVGYMYNKVYPYSSKDLSSSTVTYKYSKGFDYDETTKKYKLKEDSAVSFSDINDSANQTSLNNAHYTCFNSTGECETLSYIYGLTYGRIYYINLTNNESVETALNEMLHADNVNTTNSIMKTAVDAWFKKYIVEYFESKHANYLDYIEDTIYCNDRSIINLGGWNPDGGSITASALYFKDHNTNYDSTKYLSCTNETDKFSTSNNKAKLTYPVGLMTNPEMKLLNNDTLRKTDNWYRLASPFSFYLDNPSGGVIHYLGSLSANAVNLSYGARPAISLASNATYTDGDGSTTSPYIIEVE